MRTVPLLVALAMCCSTAHAKYKGHSAQVINSFGKRKPETWTLRATRTAIRLDSADKKHAYLHVRGRGTTLLLLDQKRVRSAGLPMVLRTLFSIESTIGRTGGKPCLGSKCKKVGVKRKFGRLCEKWVEVQTDVMGKPVGKIVYFIDKKMWRLISRTMPDGSRLELRRFKVGAQPDALFSVPKDFKR